MSGLQRILIFSALSLFLVLYFGFDTKSPKHSQIEKDRKLSGESADISVLLRDAKESIPPDLLSRIVVLEERLEDRSAEDSVRIELLKQLSGTWYDARRADLAGVYAEEIAKLNEDDEAWAIAATTYALGARQAKEEKVKKFCQGRVVKAFENAISLAPTTVKHKVNLALTYVERPPESNPMKGVLMLIDLNKKNPDDPMVLFHLGRLAIQTGQYEKAVGRLKRVIEIEPDHINAHCLLAQALKESGDLQQAAVFEEKCAVLKK